LTLNLTIPISGRLDVEKDRAGAAYDVQLRRVVDAEWSMRAEIRRAWAAWTASAERAQLLEEAVEQVERIESIAARLESFGELNRVEARLLRIELVDRRAELIGFEFDAKRARLTLLGLMGLAPDSHIKLLPSLDAARGATSDDAIERLIKQNTTLAVQRAEYLVAEETLRLEVRKQYPDITIGSGYGSEDEDDRLLLGFSLPIPILNANRAGIANAQAHRDVARATAETTFERLAHEFALAQAALGAATAQRERYEAEIVPLLAEQAEEIERIASLGEVNTLLLLETVTRQFDAKSRLLELRVSEINGAVTITELLGPESVAQPAPVDATQQTDTPASSSEIDSESAEGGAP